MTLIELIIAIVVVAIAVVGLLALISSIASRSSEGMVRAQSVAIANAYLEEILGMAFVPDGVEANRSLYDDVQDYNVLPDNLPRTRSGNAMTGVDTYQVAVTVTNNVLLGTAPRQIAATQVTVTVTSPTGDQTRLTGFRTPYAGQVIY